MYCRASLSVVNLHQFLKELCLFLNLEYRKSAVFFALFSYMLWHIELKFCIYVLLSFNVLQSKIEFVTLRQFLKELCLFVNLQYRKCHQFPSLFAGVMLLFNFKLLQICSFPHFSPTCFDILSSNFAYGFVLIYYRSTLSVVTLHPSCSSYVHPFSALAFYMHWQLSWHFTFDFGSFNAFLLEKCYIKIAFWNVHDGRIMHRLWCSGIFGIICSTQASVFTMCLLTIL